MVTARSILLVEDNPSDEELTVRTLAKHSLANSVQVVRDGAEALDYLFCRGAWEGRDPASLPQVVLLDLKLPKMDGLDVLRALRAEEATRTLPVVILTSSDEEADLVAGYEAGANSYVRKPVNFGEFALAVARVGFYWLLLNEVPPAVK